MRRFLTGTAAGLLLLISSWMLSVLWRSPECGLLPIEPPTPYTHYRGVTEESGKPAILVVHGLNASRNFMQLMSLALADNGFSVYSIDLPGHGDSTLGFNAVEAREAVAKALSWLESRHSRVVPIGHSLGAGMLLDLANDRRFDRVIFVSPPPTPLAQLQIERALVVTGDWDMPRINAFIPELEIEAGPGLEWRKLDLAGHSSVLFNPFHLRVIVEWLENDSAVDMRSTWMRMLWLGWQAAAALMLAWVLFSGRPVATESKPGVSVWLRYVLACSVAVIVLRFTVVLSWIDLFAADYLVSFMFVTGMVLISQSASWDWQFDRRAVLKAFAAAAFVILVIGILCASHVIQFVPVGGRWWRFVTITLAGIPLFLHDEAVVRPMAGFWLRTGAGILTRVLFGASIATGVLILNPADAFLVLIIHLVVLFWITLWLTTHFVHRYVQNPFAAALFAAIVQGWCFASWFVID